MTGGGCREFQNFVSLQWSIVIAYKSNIRNNKFIERLTKLFQPNWVETQLSRNPIGLKHVLLIFSINLLFLMLLLSAMTIDHWRLTKIFRLPESPSSHPDRLVALSRLSRLQNPHIFKYCRYMLFWTSTQNINLIHHNNKFWILRKVFPAPIHLN